MRRLLFALALGLTVVAASPATAKIAATILVGGNPLDATTFGQVQLVTVEQTANAPAACTIELAVSRQATPDTPFTPGQTLVVNVSGATLFKGEVVGIEPIWDVRGSGRIIVRGYDRLHTLTRSRRTKTYQQQTDADIVKRLAEEAGLQAVTTEPGYTRPDHVYQHNQTDLEFIRARAARIGYEVLVEDGTLSFRPAPSLDGTPERNVTLVNPRLFGAQPSPSRVEVRGWDPVTKTPIVGQADGSTAGVPFLEDHADPSSEEPLLSHYLFSSQAEADAVAKASLRARVLASQTAEGHTDGDPTLHVGMTVQLDGAGARFGGKYLVTGCTHKLASKGEPYRTYLSLARNGSPN